MHKMRMNVDEYQNFTDGTAEYPEFYVVSKKAGEVYVSKKTGKELRLEKAPYVYPILGLVGEAGEVANAVKKIGRDNDGVVTDEIRENVVKELGDGQWYQAQTARKFGVSMSTILEKNVSKLTSRRERGKIRGSGDKR